MSEPLGANLSQLTLWSEAIPASATAMRGGTETAIPLSAFSSSAWLTAFVHGLSSVRIPPPSAGTRRGRGTDSKRRLSNSVTRWCPSASGRVALALTIDGTGCSCSPNMRAPNARDWKGMSARSWRERTKGDKTPTLPDQIGGTPHPEYVEALMGFPIGWTDC